MKPRTDLPIATRHRADLPPIPYQCAAVAFQAKAEGIVSSDIVGYQNIPNDVSGYCQRGGTFIGVGSTTDSYDIQNIVPQKPTSAATELEDGGAVIQEINDYGETIATYSYFIEGSAETPTGKAGWYYFDETKGNVYANKTFVRGVGFLYQAPYFENADEEEVGSSFQNAGKVDTTAKSVLSEVSGYCHRANYRPVELSIQKLTPKGTADAATELEDGGAVIQEINDYGETIATYSYFIAGSAETPEGKAGWYYFDEAKGNVYADKVFAPGEGFLYQAPYFENDEEEEIGSYLEFAE